MTVQLKRIYASPSQNDGFRILVDRLWPRGIKKEDAQVDLWLKEIAPSDALRKWFGHDVKKWDEFKSRYFKELDEKAEVVERIREKSREGPVTLLFAAKDEEHNNAAALQQYLAQKFS